MEGQIMKRILSQHGLLFVAAIILGLCFGHTSERPAFAEDGNSTTISGKISSIAYGAWRPFGGRRSTLVIEDEKENFHTVYVGHNTVYIPHRTPVAGDKVSVVCIKKKGLWAGVQITYK